MKRGRKPKCPYCRGAHTISKGVRQTVTLGVRRLRVCKDCERKFTVGRSAAPAMPVATAPAAASVVASVAPLSASLPALIAPPSS